MRRGIDLAALARTEADAGTSIARTNAALGIGTSRGQATCPELLDDD